MIDSVQVIYGCNACDVDYQRIVKRVSILSKEYSADFDLHIGKSNMTIRVYPFSFSGAKEITEKHGADIMRALIYICEAFINNGHLLSVEMSTALPF